MQCDAKMMQQLINQATTTLKTEYILRTYKLAVDAESDQHVNIYSYAVHCDRRWPSTQ